MNANPRQRVIALNEGLTKLNQEKTMTKSKTQFRHTTTSIFHLNPRCRTKLLLNSTLIKCSAFLAINLLFATISMNSLIAQSFSFFQLDFNVQNESGFHVENGKLFDGNDNEFIVRGVNFPFTWFFPDHLDAIDHIANCGANTVRVVLASGQRWQRTNPDRVRWVIQECKKNDLICMLEVHDTTGYGEQEGAASLSEAVDYWIDIKDELQGEERYVLLNIGNEPFGNLRPGETFQNTQLPLEWKPATINAIQRLRAEGFKHTLVVDGPNWGQDWTNTMRDNAAHVLHSDPDKNVLFSVHMYEVYENLHAIKDYLDPFLQNNLPVIVGEFGNMHNGMDIDEDSIMQYAESNRIGYVAWSWSGNGEGAEHLDLVCDFDPDDLTGWGQQVLDGMNGIKKTSEIASVYPIDSGPVIGFGPFISLLFDLFSL